jgi:hypothetical protein
MAEDRERTVLRRELIRELFEEERSISELSERYGLSRKTIHRMHKSGPRHLYRHSPRVIHVLAIVVTYVLANV